MTQSALMRAQSLEALENEIRSGERTLFKKTAQVARERMSYYAYSSDPGNSSVWQLRGRRSPVEAIRSENRRRIEVVVGPIHEQLAQQGTINTLGILSLEGEPLQFFDSPTIFQTNSTPKLSGATIDIDPRLTLPSEALSKSLTDGYTLYGNRLQKYVVFPVFANAKILAHIYYGLDFENLKQAFESESDSTVWWSGRNQESSVVPISALLAQFDSKGSDSATISAGETTYATGKDVIKTASGEEKELVFVKDISATFDASQDFQLLMLGSLIVLLVLSTTILFVLLRQRLAPLGSSIKVLKDLSEGDLNSRVDYSRDDEIGRISQAIDIFRERLVNFNKLNNEARRQRMRQQEVILARTAELVDLLPIERATALEREINLIEGEIESSLDQQNDKSLTVSDNSVTELFAKSFSLLGQELSEQYSVLDQKVKERTLDLEKKSNEIADALQKNEDLILNILPKSIADRMTGAQSSIAEHFSDASILFADLVGFTKIARAASPEQLVDLLGGIFSDFDALTDQLNLEKIKTIGDSYMIAGGVPEPSERHCDRMATMAILMQKHINQIPHFNGTEIQLRVGIHSGPVIAGVIGTRKFAYDLWGDTVNIASRMESHGLPGRIQVSEVVYEKLRDNFQFEERGIINVKGRGTMTTYWLISAL
ncbi:HAMP domain-containing protein [Luminiphilus sp.]|nr:adenylate/guanylate cyclase domain-containing protein [Luminiphilus sp.]MDA9722074.1 HAMP domain-containing protein [Luminiphilus sp.]